MPLFDSGQAGDFLFYVMPCVMGESLRQKLRRQTQLAMSEALQITRQVAGALEYAHRQGVIHRDIKPENILLHEGEALVTDFGIALSLVGAGLERLTETGLVIGTPAYMSPEQARGAWMLDQRSDVYSLACVVYAHGLRRFARHGDAERALNKLLSAAEEGYVSSYHVALVYFGMGRYDEMFSWLERAYAERSTWMVWFHITPSFDPVRHDPRFIDLTNRMRLPKDAAAC